MRLAFFLIIALIAASCSVSKNLTYGRYYKKGKDFTYQLVLNQDHSFELTKSYFEAKSFCKGKWRTISKSEIVLTCESNADVASALTSGNIAGQEQKIMIVSSNQLNLNGQVLKKTN